MKYEHYSASDFVQDPFFQQWVLQQDEAAHMYWTKWLQEHPDRKDQVDEAIEMMRVVEMDHNISLNQTFIEVWQQIYPRTIGKKKQRFNFQKAAIWIGFLLLSMGTVFWLGQQENEHYYQAGGTSATYILPDSSQVTLNAQSSLTYRLTRDGIREVWLDGEAFFEVKKWKPSQDTAYAKFVIYTDHADVQVLGTSFNLNEGRKKTQLVLHTGKVKLLSHNQKVVYVRPGEFVEVEDDFSSVVKKSVDTRLYTSWVENKVVFDQTPLSDIMQWIEDEYDKEVILSDPALDSVTFTATIPNVELDILLEALALAYQVKIFTEEDRILIGE